MRRWKHIFFFVLLPVVTNAQVSSKGRFSVAFERGCNPMTVNIMEHDTFGIVTRQYYYFEGAGITNNTTFTYQDPGVYQIVQVVGVDGVEKSDTLFVEALESLKPEVQFRKCNGLQVSVTSQDVYYDSIRVYFTTTDSATLLSSEVAEFTYSSGTNEVIGLKGFFNNADEVCTSYFEEIVPIPVLQAPSISNASIKESCKDVFTLYLNLDVVDTLIDYRINLAQESTSTELYSGTLDQTSLIFQDITFSRGSYCLNIEAFDPCNGTSSFSTDFCTDPSDLSLSPFESLYSSYSTSGIYINLDQVNTGAFQIYRRLEGEEFELRSEQSGSFIDPIGSNGRKYFYKIDYVDSCGQILFTAETNPPLIDASKETTNQYQIAFSPPVNSLTESVANTYQSGNDFSQSSGPISNAEFSIQLDAKDGDPRQFITATSTYGNGITLNSNAATVRYELVIYVPTAFTPDGDGLNDTLELFGLPTEVATTKVYTRWGQLIYSSDQPSPGWDGSINGKPASEGTYLYEVIFETAGGEKRMQKGTFALIKK